MTDTAATVAHSTVPMIKEGDDGTHGRAAEVSAEDTSHWRHKSKKKKKSRKRSRSEDSRGRGGGVSEERTKKKKNHKHEKKGKECDRSERNDEANSEAAISQTPKGDLSTTQPVPVHKMTVVEGDEKIIQTSALDYVEPASNSDAPPSDVTLLLFYQYVEPPWDAATYQMVLEQMQHLGDSLHLTGRMRVAREGLNCTLTSTHANIVGFCKALRSFHKKEFADTEFKLTKDLPVMQRFPNLKVMPVQELVHYGLENEKAPPITYTGDHLQPQDYHNMLQQENTVVIDVRNHYEAAIGHFQPPTQGAEYLDPKMRKSTEFPIWLDKESTKEKLKGKQVMMFCTGGVRCERASALLKYKMETDPDIKQLGIKGVCQLQGGIDKYFKQFPDGGYWKGKNYVFDKRFAHAPPKVEGATRSSVNEEESKQEEIMGNCEACGKPWDMYRGKRRCPTCGVPSLICRACFEADKNGTRKLDRNIRCELCVEENVTSKAQLRQREQQDVEEYEKKMAEKGVVIERQEVDRKSRPKYYQPAPNPDGVTRLLLKNMCRRNMTEEILMETLPGITHIVWRTDRKTGQFFGSGWVEMATPVDAARAVGMNGKRVLGRPLYISYQPPDGKDAWPPPSSAARSR